MTINKSKKKYYCLGRQKTIYVKHCLYWVPG